MQTQLDMIIPATAILILLTGAAALRLDIGSSEPISGRLQADQTAEYQIRLEGGRLYVLELEQGGLDLLVDLVDPHGSRQSYNYPFLRLEREGLLLEPATSGDYALLLRSDEYTGAVADYRLRLRRLAPGAAGEPATRALRSETTAARLYRDGDREAHAAALEALRSAAALRQQAGDVAALARCELAAASLLYLYISHWRSAAEAAASAAAHYESLGERSLYASALHLRGAALIEEATTVDAPESAARLFEQASSLFDEARRIKAELGEDYELGRIINDIGMSYFYRSDWDNARRYFRQALPLFRAHDEWSEEVKPLHNLAVMDYEQRNLTAALQSYERIIELLPADRLLGFRADLLDNMAATHRALGRIDRALAEYWQSLSLHERLARRKGQGRALSGIGVTYYSAGDLELARHYLERATAVRRETQDGAGLASTLRYLGSVYLGLGELERAIDAHREALQASAPADRARAGVLLGGSLAQAGRTAQAIDTLQRAHAEALATGAGVTAADALVEHAALLSAGGEHERARTELQQALERYRSRGIRIGEAAALRALALDARRSGRLDEATEYAGAALERIEELRGLIASPELRAAYLGSRHQYYELLIDLLVEPHAGAQASLGRALLVSEQARARALLDVLAQATVEIERQVDPALLARRAELLTRLAELRARQARLVETGSSASELADLLAALDRVDTELRVIESRLWTAGDRYAALLAPPAFDVAALQTQLDTETVVLEYALGERRSHMFVLTESGLDVFPLPPRDDINTLARRAHELLRVLNPDPAARRERERVLGELSHMLLGPVAAGLRNRQRIALVLDDALHYLPFAVLPLEQDAGAAALIETHELIALPSVTALAAQRRTARPSEPSGTLAIVADPVFAADDERLTQRPAAVPDVARLERLRGNLTRLPGTAVEAESIGALVAAGSRHIATGFEASRELIVSGALDRYRILHFATHGLVDTRYPALSALALSNYDASGAPQPGLLRLDDIYNLELAADLVVLSACDLALGRQFRGEGLIGLTRGFQFAGADSVIASLWQVPDRSSIALMREFYERMLEDRLAPAAALRAAQRTVAADPRWRDPYYWAAYLIQGDWRGNHRAAVR